MAIVRAARSGRAYAVDDTFLATPWQWRTGPGREESSGHTVTCTLCPGLVGAQAQPVLRDAGRLSNFHHPGLAPLMDLIEQETGLILVHFAPGWLRLDRCLSAGAGRLSETLALSLVRDACLVLAELHKAGLVHGALHLGSCELTAQKRLMLTRALPPALEEAWPPGNRSLEELSTTAPERLAESVPPLQIAADVWALGCCLFHLVTRTPLYQAATPDELSLAIQTATPSWPERVKDRSQAIREILAGCLAVDGQERYSEVHQLAADLDRAMQGQPVQRTRSSGLLSPVRSGRDLSTRSDIFDVAEIQEHVRKRQAEKAALSPSEALGNLLRHVMVARDGMCAWVVLAANTRFPREVLVNLLKQAGVVEGWREAGILEATAAAERPRRIILAEGIAPRPGVAGRTVRGEPVEGMSNPVLVVVSEDHLTAIAHTPPGELVPVTMVQQAISEAKITAGLDHEALAALSTNGSDQGQTVIARGTAPVAAIPGSFRMVREALPDPKHPGITLPREVRTGDVIAEWVPTVPGQDGLDVYGQTLPRPTVQEQQPPELAGDGTGLAKTQDRILLMAERHGGVQVLPDGSIRVIPQREIWHDIGLEDSPLEIEDLLIIHGSILDGVVVKALTDLVVMGDLGDAQIEVGGRLEVSGTIKAGTNPVHVAGRLVAQGLSGRTIICGELEVNGIIDNCQVVATGSVKAQQVQGGTITAARHIRLQDAGHSDGRTTVLWAGHHVPNALRRDLARLEAGRLKGERGRMVDERNRFGRILEDLNLKSYMYTVGGYMRQDYLADLRSRITRLAQRARSLEVEMEEARHSIVEKHHQEAVAAEDADDRQAVIDVAGQVFPGVSMKVADTGTRVFTQNQTRVYLRMGDATR